MESSTLTPLQEDEGEQNDHAEHNAKGVGVELSGLQLRADPAERARGIARTVDCAVDETLVDDTPQAARYRHDRPHNCRIVDLVDVPLVVENLCEPRWRRRVVCRCNTTTREGRGRYGDNDHCNRE